MLQSPRTEFIIHYCFNILMHTELLIMYDRTSYFNSSFGLGVKCATDKW